MSATRRIVTFNRVTADGYFSAPDGNLDWAVPDAKLDKAVGKEIAEAGADPASNTLLFGRRTYELFAKFWPTAVDDSPTAPDPHGDRRSKEIRAMGVFLNEATKIVFSRTLKDAKWKNSRLVPELDLREVEAMKKQPGNDIIVFGSGSIASQLTQHGLIDEYRFVVSPLLLGGGRPLISGVPKSSKLDLLEAKAYPSGNVMLRYARAK